MARNARRIAVLGIKPDSHSGEPAHYVAAYLAEAGIDVIPVPVYYPDVGEILGRPVIRDLRAIDGQVDIVCVFRRSADVLTHVEDLVAMHPKTVWMQLGIRNERAAEWLTQNGIDVVQDRCLMVDHRAAVATE